MSTFDAPAVNTMADERGRSARREERANPYSLDNPRAVGALVVETLEHDWGTVCKQSEELGIPVVASSFPFFFSSYDSL